MTPPVALILPTITAMARRGRGRTEGRRDVRVNPERRAREQARMEADWAARQEGAFSQRVDPKGTRKWFWGKPLVVLLAFFLFYDASLVAAPLLLPPGTVVGLNGSANTVDYREKWEQLPNGYFTAIYWFADSQCHQKETRSFKINGNQMPMCARLSSIFIFALAGLVIAARLRPETTFTGTFLHMVPVRFAARILPTTDDSAEVQLRKWNRATVIVIGVVFLFILPVAFDGFRQELTDYESTNPVRFFTGIWTGSIGGIIMGILMNTIWFRGFEKA